MIRQITLKNFKSLRHITVDLKPLTILIGPNASGKSNFLEALEAILHLVQYKGTTRPGREGVQATISLDETLWRLAPANSEIYWQLRGEFVSPDNKTIDALDSSQEYIYNLGIKKATLDDKLEPMISQEQLFRSAKACPEERGKEQVFDRHLDQITVNQPVGQLKTDILPTDLALHFYARKSSPVVRHLHNYIQAWQFIKIIPQQMRTIQKLGKSRQLVKDGHNLANVLHYLREQQPEDLSYIQQQMQSTLHFSHLDTKEEKQISPASRGQRRIYLEAQEEVFANSKPFGADNLSDGTLGLLALLTVLSVSEPAPLICLEEPERSIHPQLIPRLAYYLHEAAHHTQLIVTTHSPEFLDYFDPYEQEHVQVLLTYRDDEGATQFVPLQQVPNMQKWLEDYMLGQIWTMGQIEEMLEEV